MDKILPIDINLFLPNADELKGQAALFWLANRFKEVISVKSIIQFLKSDWYFAWLKKNENLEGWNNVEVYNLKKFGDKKICPISLDEWADLKYHSSEFYDFVFLKILWSDWTGDDDSDWLRVVTTSTWKVHYTFDTWDIYNQTFYLWFWINKQWMTWDKEFKCFWFYSKKWQKSPFRSFETLLKSVYRNFWCKINFSNRTTQKRIQDFSDQINELYLFKTFEVPADIFWVGQEWETVAVDTKLTIQNSKWIIWDISKKIVDFVQIRDPSQDIVDIHFLDQFDNPEKMSANLVVDSATSTSNLTQVWDTIVSEIAEFVGMKQNWYSFDEFVEECLSYITDKWL